MEKRTAIPALLRRALCAWLGAASLELLLLPAEQRRLLGVSALQAMSLARVLVMGALLFLALCLGARLLDRGEGLRAERRRGLALRLGRQLPFLFFSLGALLAGRLDFNWGYLAGCLLIMLLLTVYALRGWDPSPEPLLLPGKASRGWGWLTALAALGFFAVLSVWGIARVRSLNAPSYDFGIFAQMFARMRRTGAPVTTLERQVLLSHFRVHLSPIYYLMLPFYCLVPRPETLQVLQAAVLASAVLPLWKLGRLHGLPGSCRFLLCLLLLLAPAFGGGAAYDLHENCFLAPLLLWLLWGIDRDSRPVTLLAAALTLCVKEDAAVYVALIGLFTLLRGALRPSRRAQLWTGLLLLSGALLWFGLAAWWMSRYGEGIMASRYRNLMYDGSDSLLSVIRAVLLCPFKAVHECFRPEKLSYIGLTMGLLLGMPLWTRRYERFVLLIPWLLVNLLTGYVYQYDIYFQYSFGSLACLLYLSCVNLGTLCRAEEKQPVRTGLRLAALLLAAVLSLGGCWRKLQPRIRGQLGYWRANWESCQQVRARLEAIPAEASVSASTYLTTALSDRELLYDLEYIQEEELLQSDYVILDERWDAGRFASSKGAGDGTERLTALLTERGYRLTEELPGRLRIFEK